MSAAINYYYKASKIMHGTLRKLLWTREMFSFRRRLVSRLNMHLNWMISFAEQLKSSATNAYIQYKQLHLQPQQTVQK